MSKILIAEDDTSMRNFLFMALEKAGHDVKTAGDGLSALETIEKHKDFDLLLADVVMPGMDGIELSDKAKKIIPDLKIMFITGFAAVAMDNFKQHENAPNVLSKPFHLNDLVEQVNTALEAA